MPSCIWRRAASRTNAGAIPTATWSAQGASSQAWPGLRQDVENTLQGVKNGVVTATFGYDGDGRMVTATVGLTTTHYVGDYFERVNGITDTYYYHAGKRIAMRAGNTLYWTLTDYLGSTSKLIAATSVLTGELQYREASPKWNGGDKAYGDARGTWGITNTTKYHFTGRREESTKSRRLYWPAPGSR
jgi:hypothetical protein